MQPEYELYADVWFLTNFTMDAIALWSSGRLLQRLPPMRRVLLGSLTGTGSSMFLFFQMHHYMLYQFAVHLFVNPFMVWLCYYKKEGFGKENKGFRIKTFLCQWAAVYLAILFMGGFLEWMAPTRQGVLYILICLAGAVAAVEGAEKLFLHIRRQRETICDLLLVTQEGKISAKGFYDTGNLLVDPLVGRPVHIIKKSLIWDQVQKERLPIRLIPFHSLGMEQGIIETVTLEGMYILQESHSGHPVYLEHPVFGIAEEKLFQDDRCDVILNGKSMEVLGG